VLTSGEYRCSYVRLPPPRYTVSPSTGIALPLALAAVAGPEKVFVSPINARVLKTS